MSIFGSIKDAIFGHPPAASPAPAPASQAPAAAPAATPAPAPAASAPRPAIDADAALEKIAHAKGGPDLNWKTSIVDLMKLIDLDSSLDNRKQLATELGYTGDKDGSADMNIWLHAAVMKRIRGGD